MFVVRFAVTWALFGVTAAHELQRCDQTRLCTRETMSSLDANENDQKHGASDRVQAERKTALEKVDVNVLRNLAEACNILGFGGVDSTKKNKSQAVKALLLHTKGSMARWSLLKELLEAAPVANAGETPAELDQEGSKRQRQAETEEKRLDKRRLTLVESALKTVKTDMVSKFDELKNLLLASRQDPAAWEIWSSRWEGG